MITQEALAHATDGGKKKRIEILLLIGKIKRR